MEIITKIKPLFTSLIAIGFVDYVKDEEFLRLCNALNLTDHYSVAYNEVQAKTKNDWAWLGIEELNYEFILARLLNIIYTDQTINFTLIIAKMLAAYLPISYYVPSIASFRRDIQLLGSSNLELEIIDQAWTKESSNFHKKVTVLKNILINRAVGGLVNDEHYLILRSDLLKQTSIKSQIPDFVVNNGSVYDFWQFIKASFGSYAERRFFLQEAFEPLLNSTLNFVETVPHHDMIPQIATVDEQFIAQAWRKALDRMNEDPEAAITSARSLIELVCKHILDEKEVNYDDSIELPKLYKQTAGVLNLSPDQHSEQLFKQILGGCQTVVDGLGGLRNKFGDAHGMSKKKTKPAIRHAALAVNLSGAMCGFLLQTFNHLKERASA
ncbi:MAG: abortive infection family protein [Taibaiella sp.]|nr:abortive infection family protein [Taibaiella sp.]